MKNLPLMFVAAVMAAAVSAPAQVSIEGRIGRAVRGAVQIGHVEPRFPIRHEPRHPKHHEPVCRQPVQRGHWETVHEQYLVPGYWTEEHVPPTYGWIVDHCGHRRWGIIDQGGCRRVWVPARWETRCRKVWVSC